MRKIIQICAIPAGGAMNIGNLPVLYALCDDNTLWFINVGEDIWNKIEDIPKNNDNNLLNNIRNRKL